MGTWRCFKCCKTMESIACLKMPMWPRAFTTVEEGVFTPRGSVLCHLLIRCLIQEARSVWCPAAVAGVVCLRVEALAAATLLASLRDGVRRLRPSAKVLRIAKSTPSKVSRRCNK